MDCILLKDNKDIMNDLLKSKVFAWFAFAVVLIILVCTFSMRTVWWSFIDIFFMFMAAFINLVSVLIIKINPVVSKKLSRCTLVLIVLWILSLIGEWIAFECLI